jgi:hypothetical protein
MFYYLDSRRYQVANVIGFHYAALGYDHVSKTVSEPK